MSPQSEYASLFIELIDKLEKMDQRSRDHYKELDNNALKMRQEIEARQKDTENYIKRDATGIEKETTLAVKTHLVNNVMGRKLYIPNGFLRELRDPYTGAPLTDLDGVYILTNDPEAPDFHEEVLDEKKVPLSDPLAQEKRTIAKSLTPQSIDKIQRQLVIIEAKHYVTVERIRKKIQQLVSIQNYLKTSRNLNNPELSNKFKKNVEFYGLNTYDLDVKLYIGGPIWADDAFAEFNSQIKSNPDLKNNLGLIYANGHRYAVTDSNRAFRLEGGKVCKSKSNKCVKK